MKKTNVKEKVKRFWENHKAEIICIGGLTAAVGGAGCYGFCKGYNAGIIDGGMYGFHVACSWLDETFPDESKAVELFERFKTEHPEEIVYRKGIGKWS